MTIVGDGDYRYEVVPEWPKMPEAWEFGLVSDVAVDSADNVWVYSRGEFPVTWWTPDGDLAGSWGWGMSDAFFKEPHGMFIDASGSIWFTEKQRHTVTKHDRSGKLLMELGNRDWAAVTVTHDGRHGEPFNSPTGVTVAPDGRIFVSDGYGNRRVHRFAADGTLETSWGLPGKGPGQFALPHNIGIDEHERVYVCDRENNRIQIFDTDGTYLSEWTDVQGPGDVHFRGDGVAYVIEQGGNRAVGIWSLDGEVIARWHGDDAAQVLGAVHGIWTDSAGNIYVAEIGTPEGGQRVRKYVKV